MATYYLMNNVLVGTVAMIAGSLIDSAQDDTTAIAAAGGKLVSSSEPTVAAAAVVAQAMRKAGKSPLEIQGVMLAAYSTSLDTIGGTVAVNQTKVATNQAATATNQVATAVNQTTNVAHHVRYNGPEAPATSYGTIADDASSANASAQPTHPTTLDVVFAVDYDGGDVTVHGTAPDGTAITEVFTAGDDVTRNGTKVFALLDATGSFTSDGSGSGSETATVQSGGDVGLPEANSTVVKVSEDNVNASFTQAAGQITAGSFTPATAKDGLVDYDVWYTVPHLHVQDSHNHVQDSHNHTQDTHNHTQDSHTHALS